MATYKKFCIHCNELIPGDASVCPACGTADPFDLRCPKCRSPIEKRWKVCSSCGFKLNIVCPSCGRETFAASSCGLCSSPLVVKCSNKRCGEIQIISKDKKCVKCGKFM